MPLKGAMDGRMWPSDDAGDQPRSPAGVAADLADPLLGGPVEQPRRAMGPARAICEPLTGEVAMPPLMGGGRGDVEEAGSASDRAASLDRENEFLAPSQSEPSLRVSPHPGPPSLSSWKTPSLWMGPDANFG